MLKYAAKRILAVIPVLLGVSVLVFLILQITPGDPALIMLGPRATQAALENLRHQLGLDMPIYEQYIRWIGNILKGDWGYSLLYKHQVSALIFERLSATLLLAFTSLALATVFGIFAGIISATKQYSWQDRTLMALAVVGFCLPVFWLGLIMQLFFSIKLGVTPVSGINTPGLNTIGDTLWHLVLPSFTLAIGTMATIARMTRGSMLEVVRQDYIRTARAKGVSKQGIAFKHALRNALIPVVTVVGSQFGYLLSGEVLLEMIYSWPGLGTLMINGILARDFPLVQGIILFVATIYVVVNLVVDLLYAVLDPRISY